MTPERIECPLCGYEGHFTEFETQFVIPICSECYITNEWDDEDEEDE